MGLLEAVKSHSLEGVMDALAKDANAIKREGQQALFLTAGEGDFDIVKYLTEYAGVNLRDVDREGNSVLHFAVTSGNVELARYLIERCHCNPMSGNLHGVTAFDLAHQSPYKEVEKYLEDIYQLVYEETYHNPIRQGFYPDPSVVRVGDDYYMVNSSFCFFPCIPISHSRDLVHWDIIGHVITEQRYSGLDYLEGGRGYWAPDISYNNGLFYVTATYRLNEVQGIRRMQMVTSAKLPEGPYDQPVFIEEDGIDPSLFHDDDGRHYMLLNRGARILELSTDCKQKISDSQLLWYGDYKVNPEGPHILKKNDWYYLFLAEGGTGRNHQITVSRSKTLMGPYENCPYNPIHTQTNTKSLIQCCGHGKTVMTPDGRWYMVYLCLRIPECGYGILGRETALDPIIWTADDWPIVNGRKGPSGQQKLPLPPMGPGGESIKEWEDKKKSKENGFIDPCDNIWMVHRHGKEAISKESYGTVIINGNESDLCDLACSSMLLRRQQHFYFEAECAIEVNVGDGDAGITCYYDENSYMKLGVLKENGIWQMGVWEYVGDSYKTRQVVPIACDSIVCRIKIRVRTECMKRTCFICLSDGCWKKIAVLGDTSYLSSEGIKKGKRFTGALVGIYVHGKINGIFSSFLYSAL